MAPKPRFSSSYRYPTRYEVEKVHEAQAAYAAQRVRTSTAIRDLRMLKRRSHRISSVRATFEPLRLIGFLGARPFGAR